MSENRLIERVYRLEEEFEPQTIPTKGLLEVEVMHSPMREGRATFPHLDTNAVRWCMLVLENASREEGSVSVTTILQSALDILHISVLHPLLPI